MKKLISFILTAMLIVTIAAPVFADSKAGQEPAKVIENAIKADAVTDISAAAAEVKNEAVRKSDVKSFKGKLANEFAHLEKLRAECKDLWTQIKSLNDSIKSAWSQLKTSLKDKDKAEIKKILTEKRTQLEPLRTQVKTLHSDIKSLREKKDAEWVSLKAAIKARDEGKATAALNNIIELKSQIIEKQKALIPLKQQILSIIH